ncbi:unnamed protein product [Kuraishia capsulata CBS 1993]|uniref:PCI domain-containing protein n=1 Tax=Kuraishia capsulata CBS 1993 TaxID=1382522 RepID=W6MGG8_9ASCO|nr:uncharacterized protein KUCA_T00000863001 [Kuraishia capsulata CBS 1993]CDK24896.1 unnamed protein product [Kuraishia capsulata CBS 1993]
MAGSLDQHIRGYTGPLLLKRLHHIATCGSPLAVEASRKGLQLLMTSEFIEMNFKGSAAFLKVLANQGDASSLIADFSDVNRPDPQVLLASIDTEISAYQSWQKGSMESLKTLLQRRSTLLMLDCDDDTQESMVTSLSIPGEFARKYVARESELTTVEFMYLDRPDSALKNLRQSLALFCKIAKDSEDDIDMDSNVSDTESTTELSHEEVVAYWNCRWMNLFVNFYAGRFSVVAKEYQSLLDSSSIKGVTACNVFESDHYNPVLISKNGLLKAIMISSLISCTLDDLEKITKTDVFESFMDEDVLCAELYRAFSASDYKSSNEIIDQLEEQLRLDPFFYSLMPTIQKFIRYKEYICYLSLVQQVSISHMADFVGVDSNTLVKELTYLMTASGLHMEYDAVAGVLHHKPVPPNQELKVLFDGVLELNRRSADLEASARLKSLVLSSFGN